MRIKAMNKLERFGIGAHGFTLLEVMMVVGIIAIVVPIGASVLKNNVNLFKNFTSDHVAFQEARMAAGIITDQLRGYSRLDNPTPSDISAYETSHIDAGHLHNALTSRNDNNFDIYFENNLMAKGYGQNVGNGEITTKISNFSISNDDTNNLILINIVPTTSVPSPITFKLRKKHFPTIPNMTSN